MSWVYYITDRKTCPVPLLERIRAAIDASVDFIQIREKDLSTRKLLSLSKQAKRMAQGSGTKILINDRLDVALAAKLDGVHLGQNSIPASEIRRAFGGNFIIGVSTHSIEEARRAIEGDANYLTYGPIFFTPSKGTYGLPVGVESLRGITKLSGIPVLALGGIDKTNYSQCLKQGAAGIAAIRLFQNLQESLPEIVSEIRVRA